MWAPQVAGGDEPPSVLSDNLSRSGYQARPSSFLAGFPPTAARRSQRSQIDIAKCCVLQTVAFTVESGSFPFRYQTSGGGSQGEGLNRHRMCLLRSRVRLPNSAGRRLAGNVPGEAEVEEPTDLSHARG
jgi:hypothetical protein